MNIKIKEAPEPATGRHTSFVNVPGCALRDPDLLGNDLRVYAVLLFLSGETKRFEEGLDAIAKWSSLSKRTVNRSVLRLAYMGYIVVRRRQRQTSLIEVKAPYEIYGDAVFNPEAKVRRVRRHRNSACPAASRRNS